MEKELDIRYNNGMCGMGFPERPPRFSGGRESMRIKRDAAIQMPSWRNTARNERINVEKSSLNDEVMDRLEATTKAIEESKKRNQILVGTLAR